MEVKPTGEEEEELQMALELSRRTFMEEQASRRRMTAESEPADLMTVEDPAILERNRQIERIKQLVMGNNDNSLSPVGSPTNPFLRNVPPSNFYGPFPPMPAMLPGGGMFPPPPTPFPASASPPVVPPPFECSSPQVFGSVQPRNPHNFPSIPTQSSSNASNTTIPQNPSNNQQLFVQTEHNRSTAFSPPPQINKASPLKIPFRSAALGGGADLIDLHYSPRPRSMTIEEFDPLYMKLQQLKTDEQQQQQLPGGCSATPSSSSEATPCAEEAVVNKFNKNQRRKATNGTSRRGMLSCADLRARPVLHCDFHKEKQLLADRCQRLKLGPGQNVFFLSPVLDYFVIDEDTTIKLLVHQDDTWPRDTPDEPRRLEFTCGVRNTGDEILQKVLLDLLSPEAISQNGGEIPAGDYALKVFGSDEFLVRNVAIGKHPFVGDLLAKGRDVELEVGKCRIPLTPTPSDSVKRSVPNTYPTVNAELFGAFCQTLSGHVSKCLANPEDRRLRQPVLQSIKMITTFINNVQPMDLVASIDMLYVAPTAAALEEAISYIVAALLRLFRAFCRSALTDFSVADPSGKNEDARENGQEDGHTTTKDSSLCDEKLLLSIESAHNFSGLMLAKYKSFFVEAHLMYGPKSYGMCTGSAHTVVTKYHLSHVPIQLWTDFDVHISALPRESQLCFILRGIPHAEDTIAATPTAADALPGSSAATSGYASARCSASSEAGLFAHRLASASLPLFNAEGFLLQGPLLVPLRPMEDDVVHPWGPRPLIRHPDELVLVVKCLEYDFRIQFPQHIVPSEIQLRDFHSLPHEEQETLQTLVENAVSHQLSDDDKQLLWSNRNCLHQFPRALPLVLASCFSWGPYSLSNVYVLLDKWAKPAPATAVELLLPYFQDRQVREWALACVSHASSEYLYNFIAQLVEALRYETFEHSALALFLLDQCSRDRRFAVELYWQLQHRIHDTKNPSYGARCQLLQQILLDMGIPGFANEMAFQYLFLDHLDRVATVVKEASEGNMTKVLHKELYQLTDQLDMRNVRIPIWPSFQCCALHIPDCTIFNSLTKPIKLIIQGKRGQFGIIYKAGDDLRQDAVVIQLVRVMNDIWLSEQLDLRMVLFRCMPTGTKKGLIELVPNCSTLREIQIVGSGAAGVFKDEVLSEWLARQNPSEFQYKAALENFRRSCAGWCVATYVLGIGDRHNDNILVTTNGHVFHIDFGKYMGDWQMAGGFKRDRVPFVFTPEMAYVINGGQSSTEHFQRFVDECCQALNLLRKNAQALVNIMRFLSCSDIPGMSMESVAFVENNLLLDLSDVQATMLFTQMINESLQSKFPRWNFLAHTLAQFKGNPLGGRSEDMNRLSFISELYNEKGEGRIESVHVSSYEKWKNPEKIYMYKLLMKRVNENVTTEIYRSFAEFQELHWKLCFRFSSRAIPPLSQTVTMGRTNIRAVAARRQVDLQYFLQRLFALSDEVAHSELVYTFMHPIYRDTEPEARKLNGVPDIFTDGLAQCQLLLRLAWDDAQCELRVFVGHAKNLPLVGREQAPDSYVKTYLRWAGSGGAQRQWKRKTHAVRNAQNPTYNAEICYSLSPLLPPGCPSASRHALAALHLDVAVWHTGNAVLKDNFQLAECSVPLADLLGVGDTASAATPAGGTATTSSRRGRRELESWFTLSPACG